jgi:hypothetical protein
MTFFREEGATRILISMPCFLGERTRESHSNFPVSYVLKISETPYFGVAFPLTYHWLRLTLEIEFFGWSVAQVVEYFPNKHKAQNSNSNTTHTTKKRN